MHTPHAHTQSAAIRSVTAVGESERAGEWQRRLARF
jgi:hypothetical protein